MANTDILQAIRIIDDKIASLQDARNRIASAFGIDDNLSNAIPTITAPAARNGGTAPTVSVSVTDGATNGGRPNGRKEQLAAFLNMHGPMSRSDIVEKAGLPEGTVSYCLSDKRFFEQLENGDWAITDFSRKGLQRKHPEGFQLEDQ